MTNARVISGAAVVALCGPAAQHRECVARQHFAEFDFSLETENKKSPKPRFEIHEREIGKREYLLTLIERNNANHTKEVGSIRLGFYGKKLDRPAKEEVEQTVAPAVKPALSQLEQAVQEHMAENPDADIDIVELEMAEALAS